jgi:endoglucanase
MRDPKAAYDASAFGGIAFWARRSPETAARVRVHLPDRNTDPDGGVCTECYNDFGADIVLDADWKKFAVPVAGFLPRASRAIVQG